LSKRIIGFWLADRRFYQMSVIENEGSNPEFRITDDTRLATEPIVEFAIGLASAVLTAAAFVGILWSVGGAFTIPLGGGISIPGYMVIAALVYSAIASIPTLMISRTLMHRVAEKNEGEAELRYELTRVREGAETIALLAGDADEEKRLGVTSTPCCSDGSPSQFSRRGSPGLLTEIQLSRRSFRCFSAPRNSLRER
jgi:putative ATP-binding cassette transporter